MATNHIWTRLMEAFSGLQELARLRPAVRESLLSPRKFWTSRRHEIITGLKSFYSVVKKPDVEIMVPIHHNAHDLPLLLYGLSRQRIPSDKRVGLTLLMHNNRNISKWKMHDDGSWKFVNELLAAHAPVKILTLADPLLSGAHMAWQYLLANGTGKILAIIDADSLPPPQWLLKIIKPMETDGNVRFTGGIRVEMTGRLPHANFISRIACFWIAISNAALPGRFNLPLMKAFQGGQAAYNRKLIRPVFRRFFGGPEGDSVFAQFMINEYGRSCFAYADAPVYCKITNPKKLSPRYLFRKFQRISAFFLPKRLTGGWSVNQPRLNTTIHFMHQYSVWFRPIIDAYVSKKKLDAGEVADLFRNTAVKQGFAGNLHVSQFISRLRKKKRGIENNRQLYDLYESIALRCHRPTLKKHLGKT